MTKSKMLNKLREHGWEVEAIPNSRNVSAIKNGREIRGMLQKVYNHIFGY